MTPTAAIIAGIVTIVAWYVGMRMKRSYWKKRLRSANDQLLYWENRSRQLHDKIDEINRGKNQVAQVETVGMLVTEPEDIPDNESLI